MLSGANCFEVELLTGTVGAGFEGAGELSLHLRAFFSHWSRRLLNSFSTTGLRTTWGKINNTAYIYDSTDSGSQAKNLILMINWIKCDLSHMQLQGQIFCWLILFYDSLPKSIAQLKNHDNKSGGEGY